MFAETVSERRAISIGPGRWLIAGAVGGALSITIWLGMLDWVRSFLVPSGGDARSATLGGVAASMLLSLGITAVVAGAANGLAHAAILRQGRAALVRWVAFGCLGNLLYMLAVMLVRPTLGLILPADVVRIAIYTLLCVWMSLFLWFCAASADGDR